MALSPISYIAINYRDYYLWWLKVYNPGTTTPKSMSLDSEGAVTVAKLEINQYGFLVSAGGALVTPYIDDSYDAWIFPTAAEADANDTSNALRVADDMLPVSSSDIEQEIINDLSQTYNFTSISSLESSNIEFPVGKKVAITSVFAEYIVVDPSDTGGWYLTSSAGVKFRHVPSNNYIAMEELLEITYSVTVCNDAVSYCDSLDVPLVLQGIYAVNDTIDFTENSIVNGLSRDDTGFIAVAPFGTLSTRSITRVTGDNVQLYNFHVYGDNLGDAGAGIRYNCVAVTGDIVGISIRSVDVSDCTGYGHVVFGTQADPQTKAYYEDCVASNCQVLFEQIGALEVNLQSCRGIAVLGRTAESFHPYAASKNITYTNCSVTGNGGAGINIVTTLGNDVGKIRFINCDVNIDNTTSAINLAYTSGDQALIDVEFIGGSYVSTQGAALASSSSIKFKAIGTYFKSETGFNLPSSAFYEADVTLTDCEVVTERESASAQCNGIITNGQTPKIIGGSVTAINTIGSALAINGTADTSLVTTTPPSASTQLDIKSEVAGIVAVTPSVGNGFFNISTGFPMTDRDNVILSLSYRNSSDINPVDYSVSWSFINDNLIRVRLLGMDSGDFTYRLTYLK